MFILNFKIDQLQDMCTFSHSYKKWFDISTIVMTGICAIFLIVCFVKIVNQVRKSSDLSGKSHHFTRALATTAILLGAFAICWLPLVVFETVMFFIFQTFRPSNVAERFVVFFFILMFAPT